MNGPARQLLVVAIVLAGCGARSVAALDLDGDVVAPDASAPADDLAGAAWAAIPCGEPLGLDVDGDGGLAVASSCVSADGAGLLVVTRIDAQGQIVWETQVPGGRLCDAAGACRVARPSPVVISGPRVYVASQLEPGVASLVVLDEQGAAAPPRRICAVATDTGLALTTDQEDGVFVAVDGTEEAMFGQAVRRLTSGPATLARVRPDGVIAWVTGVGGVEGESRLLLATRPDGGIVMARSPFSLSWYSAGGSDERGIFWPTVMDDAAFITGLAVDDAGDVHFAGPYAWDAAHTPLSFSDAPQLASYGEGDMFVATEHEATFPSPRGIGDAFPNVVHDLDATTAGQAWFVGEGWPDPPRAAADDRRPFLALVDTTAEEPRARILPGGIIPWFVGALPAGYAVIAASVAQPVRLPGGGTVESGTLLAAFPAP